jgi:ribosomal protein S12 methylthiotransferase
MKRPANEARVLERIHQWREVCPDIAIRSSFVGRLPGETEEISNISSTGLPKPASTASAPSAFEPVEGAAANALPTTSPKK